MDPPADSWQQRFTVGGIVLSLCVVAGLAVVFACQAHSQQQASASLKQLGCELHFRLIWSESTVTTQDRDDLWFHCVHRLDYVHIEVYSMQGKIPDIIAALEQLPSLPTAGADVHTRADNSNLIWGKMQLALRQRFPTIEFGGSISIP